MDIVLAINPQKEKKRIVSFLQKTLREQGFEKVVIGVSGGVDSTTCLYLLKEALPLENIFVAQLDYFARSNKSVNGVLERVKVPKQNIYKISIKKIVEETRKTIQKSEDTYKNTVSSFSKIRLANITARVRMIILFDLAKKYNALVCGTENKTEHLLGYYTRFGDEASDIEPIRHLYKTQVYQLAKYLGGPDEIINQKPTAGLWSGQTDEGEFGFTYEEADQVLYLYFDKKMSTEKIVKMGYKNAKKILDFAKKNQFKQQTPYRLDKDL